MFIMKTFSLSTITSMFFTLLVTFFLPALVSCQSYGNMTYNKLSYLMTFHDEDFDVDTSNLHNDYIESVITVPIITTIVLFLIFLIFELSLMFRCCCQCLRCMNHGKRPDDESSAAMFEWKEGVNKSKSFLTRSFYTSMVLCFIVTGGIIWSMQHFQKGTDNAIDATVELKDVAISLEDSGNALDIQGSQVLHLTQEAIPTCPEATAVETYAEEFEQYIAEYLDIVEPLPSNLEDLEDFLNEWSVGDVESGYVFGVYILFVVLTIPLLIAFCLKSKCCMKISLCCGLFFIHILLIAFCLYFIALSIMGDFCQAPTDNLISITPDSVVEEATYYGTCNGTNPIEDPVTDAYDAVEALELAINTLTASGGDCERNTYLLACLPIIEDMYVELDDIEQDMSCDPLQKLWGDIVNDATCHNVYTGLFILTLSVILVVILYFSLLIFSSLIYQYFGELWSTDDTEKLLIGVSQSGFTGELHDLSSEDSSNSGSRRPETQLTWERNSEDQQKI